MKNTYQKYIDNILGEFVYIVNVETKELVYISNGIKEKFNLDLNTSNYIEFIEKLDVLCLLDKVDTIQMDKIGKVNYHSNAHNTEYIIKYKLVDYEGEKLLIQALYDITEEVISIRNLEQTEEINKSIIECANTLLKDFGTKTNIYNLLKIICDFYKGARTNLLLFNDDNKTIKFVSDYSKDSKMSDLAQSKSFDFPIGAWGKVLENNNFYSDNVAEVFCEFPMQLKVMEEFNVKSFMASAIQKDGKNIGFVTIDNPKYMCDNFDVLDTATIFLANNIERQLFETELENSVLDVADKIDETKVILECAEILFKNKDINTAMTNLLSAITRYYKATRCSMLEYITDEEEHDNLLHLKIMYEYNSEGASSVMDTIADNQIHQDLDMYNKINEHKCVYTKLKDLDIKEETMEHDILMKNGVESVMVLPIRRNDKVIALVLVQNPTVKLTNVNVLYSISGFIVSELSKRDIVKELEHLSFSDKLTGLFNRNYYLKALEILEMSPPEKLGVIFADINGLKRVNDNLGHEYGDAFIRWCGDFLKRHSKGLNVFRIGGDEFICLVYNMNVDQFFEHIKIMRDELHSGKIVNMSMGGTFVDGNVDINQQIVETDKIMYYEKQKYYILKKIMNVNVESELDTLKDLLEKHLD